MAVKKLVYNKSLREMTIIDLKDKINAEENRLLKLRFAHRISPLENPQIIKHVRRDLARAKTELQHRNIQSNN